MLMMLLIDDDDDDTFVQDEIELRRLRTENRLLRQRIDLLENESSELADKLIQVNIMIMMIMKKKTDFYDTKGIESVCLNMIHVNPQTRKHYDVNINHGDDNDYFTDMDITREGAKTCCIDC